MQDIQSLFSRIQDAKRQQKEIRKSYKSAVEGVLEYQEIQEKMKSFRERKKRIEQTIKEQFSSELIKLEDLKIDIESDVQVLTDVAIAKITKGESIEVTDEHQNEYEPIFSVKFKKIG
ncbi:MAG TPA: hypothetical protein DCS29_00105 [Candidatus Magasanikbacteria bacterium]|nr:MAG: hypothetical protein A2479_02205 [Candidatus Magasanikbacteria bacterium RIFOXYC2_FULL_39_8]HAT03167.1 hypothetical protein [Candidatus Magasanikbacteria bacterium]